MRVVTWLLAGTVLYGTAASASEKLEYGPAPGWVVPQPLPATSNAAAEAPVAYLLSDQQVRLEPGRITTHSHLALKVQTSDGLSAGNVIFMWQPATDTVTVNTLQILRDGKPIDILKSGQTFTIARRETNLEAAAIDGSLTANIQPEGLQVGDIIELATTSVHIDPVMKGHVEANYGSWNGVPIALGHAALSWPSSVPMVSRQTPSLPQASRKTAGGTTRLELRDRNIEPLILPKDAPERFRVGRFGEVSDFKAWSQVADLMAPLYQKAAAIPASGSLRDEVEAIRKANSEPKVRTRKALELVQQRIRYVALLMGAGGYVPATAQETWSRKFGDCKAKTALLLAILHELGIDAVPTLVGSSHGDILPDRLPMVGYFDHVIVRAQIDGKTYWLDGTRNGDGDIDRIDAPSFEWGLPVIADASLQAIARPPLGRPSDETVIRIDASKGIHVPAPISAEHIFRGDAALLLKGAYAQLTASQADQVQRELWRRTYDDVDIKTVSNSYDPQTGQYRISMTGLATLDWKDGWYQVPDSAIAFDADFNRADGPFRDAPLAIAHPRWETAHVEVRLPPGFAKAQKTPPLPVKEVLAGTEYSRIVRLTDGSKLVVDTSERTLQPEVPFKDAEAAQARLRSLNDDNVYIRIPQNYGATDGDLTELAARKPTSADDLILRGNTYLNAGKFEEAMADFKAAQVAEPDNATAAANLGIALAWKGELKAAETQFARAAAKDPKHAVVLRGRGFVSLLQGDLQKAVDDFTRSLEVDPGNIFALLNRAGALEGLGKSEAALKDLDRLLEKQPDLSAAREMRAKIFRAEGDDEKALAESEIALKSGQTSPDIRLTRANILRKQGKRDLVIKEAEMLMEEHPESTFAFVAAANILAAVGKRQEALAVMDKALKVNPEGAYLVYVNRTRLRAKADVTGRLADLDAALKAEPNDPEATELKAQVLIEQNRFSEAVTLYEDLFKSDTRTDPPLLNNYGIALYKAGREKDAIKQFELARAKAQGARDYNNLCWGKGTATVALETALTECQRAMELDPDNPGYLDSLGLIYLRLGRLDDALKAYSEAVNKASYTASLMGRAIVYARMGDIPRAQADRKKALEQDPDAEDDFKGYGLTIEQKP